MVELYFTIEVWKEIIAAALLGIIAISYAVYKLIDYFRWKKNEKW